MTKYFTLLTITILFSCSIYAQNTTYHNEWIQADQSYYKVKVAQNGIYRIPYNALFITDLPREGRGYQLYHKGQAVPIYVTRNTEFAFGDFIEFYGEKNDGSLDADLYENPAAQLHPEQSLFSDTSVYYLTWQDADDNLRYESISNDTSNVNNPESFFWHTAIQNISNNNTQGKPLTINNKRVFSSDFEENEGFIGSVFPLNEQQTGRSYTFSLDFLAGQSELPTTINAEILGISDAEVANDHHIFIGVNGQNYVEDVFDGFQRKNYEIVLETAMLGEELTIDFQGLSDSTTNSANAVNTIELTYPRTYSFDGAVEFEWSIANEGETYLALQNFDAGFAPIFYDLTNRLRMIAKTDTAAKLTKVVLPSGNSNDSERRLWIGNSASTAVSTILTLSPTNFVNFSNTIQQGNYLILTHPSLQTGAESYANYRRSEEGGNHQVQIISIENLYDQFYYGIDKHPLAIRNFVNFAVDNWTMAPEYLLLLGKSVNYQQTRFNREAFAACLVPTYGAPPSDNLLTARNKDTYQPQLKVGRIPVQNQSELQQFLSKLQNYEAVNQLCEPEERLWKKQLLTLAQGSDNTSISPIKNYINNYKNQLKQSAWGSQAVANFNKIDTVNTPPFPVLREQLNKGLGLIVHMGNAQENGNWLFNLGETANWSNANRYPVIVSSADSAARIHDFKHDALLSQYVLAQQKGAIACVDHANTYFPAAANTYLDRFFTKAGTEQYDEALGTHLQQTINEIAPNNPSTDAQKAVQLACQSFTLIGDPALPFHVGTEAEFLIKEEPLFYDAATNIPLSGNPILIGGQVENIAIDLIINNLGKVTDDSISVNVTRFLPDTLGTRIVATQRIPMPNYEDTVRLLVPNDIEGANGFNSLILFVDSDLEQAETCEFNNTLGLITDINEFCNGPMVNLPDTAYISGVVNATLDAGNTGATYEWSTGETTASIQATLPGEYFVTVTDAAGCPTVRRVFVVYPTSVQMPSKIADIHVYPNPVIDEIYVDIPPLTQQNVWIQLHNVKGQLLLSKEWNVTNQFLDAHFLEKGIYLLSIRLKNKVLVKRIVKM